MARIKIYLEPNETENDTRELLIKALTSHEKGSQHQDAFHQPAALDVSGRMVHEHDLMWERLLREISAVLDEEVIR